MISIKPKTYENLKIWVDIFSHLYTLDINRHIRTMKNKYTYNELYIHIQCCNAQILKLQTLNPNFRKLVLRKSLAMF